MKIKKELIVYPTQPVSEPHDIEIYKDAIASECSALNIEIIHQDDLSDLLAQPALGLEVHCTQDQLALFTDRLIDKNYSIEDGGREMHSLDEEGGEQ